MCNYDLRTMYLMDNERPSYKTFFEFINEVILPNQYVIFTKICNTIIETFQLNITNQYLDGTKIEANANKYNFVWKPIKFHKNLDDKIKEQLKLMNIDFNPNELIKSNQLFEAINLYAKDSGFNPELIPSGKGKRISKEQRYYKQCYKYLIKLIEYEEKKLFVVTIETPTQNGSRCYWHGFKNRLLFRAWFKSSCCLQSTNLGFKRSNLVLWNLSGQNGLLYFETTVGQLL